MRRYWDARAAENAVFYVDTSSDYDDPDMERFLATGRQVAQEILTGAGDLPGRGLAVEIGPGLGRVCAAMAHEFDRVVGVDVSSEMVRQAAGLVADRRVTFVVGDGRSLSDVRTGAADLVYEFTVFQHLPTLAIIDGYIAEAARVLRPGGVAAFQWNNLSPPGRWRVRSWVRIAGRRLGVRRWGDPRFSREFLGTTVPVARMAAALDAVGLDVIETKGEGTLFAWVWARRRGA